MEEDAIAARAAYMAENGMELASDGKARRVHVSSLQAQYV
jgi:hypothetical protein